MKTLAQLIAEVREADRTAAEEERRRRILAAAEAAEQSVATWTDEAVVRVLPHVGALREGGYIQEADALLLRLKNQLSPEIVDRDDLAEVVSHLDVAAEHARARGTARTVNKPSARATPS